MRLAFIADAHSPIAQNWISYFTERGHDVHLISSYPCPADTLTAARIYQLPIAFSGLSRIRSKGSVGVRDGYAPLAGVMAHLRRVSSSRLGLTLRHWIAPLEINRHVAKMRNLINDISPDLVHAMRIPFEGILAAKATPPEVPFVISVWGNDFTLFAERSRMIARQTRQAMQRVDALLCDCQRDLRLAKRWGFNSNKLSAVLPGAGGVQSQAFNAGRVYSNLRDYLKIPLSSPVVINPRGFRNYVCNETFFQAIPRVLKKLPEAIFICSAMKGNPLAEKWVAELNIRESVRLLPLVPRHQMADLFRLAQITVSPSTHDGTPNTLLEALACGCFPVVGDIESVREWIEDGVNGLLCNPASPQSIADATLKALNDKELQRSAREHNLSLIAERAQYGEVMKKAEEFYWQLLAQ